MLMVLQVSWGGGGGGSGGLDRVEGGSGRV